MSKKPTFLLLLLIASQLLYPGFIQPAKGDVFIDIEDAVDNDTSDVDSSSDLGTSSNFTAQKYGPDSDFDELTEEYRAGSSAEDPVDSISNVDSYPDNGTHSDFNALQQGPDSNYDVLTETGNSGTWWNNSYSHRIKLNVTTGSNTPFTGYAGYTVQFILNTTDLVSAGKMLSNGDDLRTCYWNGTVWQELDRHIIDMNSDATEVRFQLQANITASSFDDNYHMYYGNTGAGSGPANLSDVYLWYDDASTDREAQYTQGRLDETAHGGSWNDSISWNSSGFYQFDTNDNFADSLRPTSLSERDVYVEYEEYQTNAYTTDMTSGPLARWVGTGSGGTETSDHWYYYEMTDSAYQPGSYASHDDVTADDRGAVIVSNGILGTFPQQSYTRLAMAAWGIDPTNLKAWYDSTPSANESGGFGISGRFNGTHSDATENEGEGQAGIWLQQDAGRFRNILIRRYTEPEPSISFGSEEYNDTLAQIDLEVQWTDLISTLPNEELCIYAGSTGSEDLKVEIWNSSSTSWYTLLNDINQNTWNNISVADWLTSDTLTIRFKGGNETGDVTQDQWSIDVALVHVWSNESSAYKLDLEVQWTGVDYTQNNEELCIYLQGSWLSGWDNRVTLTIDHDDIDSNLSNFPLMIYLSNSSGRNSDDVSYVFDELQIDANRKKIAITEADGVSQCYVEIERWDHAGEQAWLWVKVPEIDNQTDTDLFLYYDVNHMDNTEYVDDTGVGNSTEVWDDNFKSVLHLSQAPTGLSDDIYDSTSNLNDGTTEGSMNSSDLVNSQIGKGLEFDANNDLIRISNSSSLSFNKSSGTIDLWIKWGNSADGDSQIVMSSSNRFTVGEMDGFEWASQGSGNHFFYPWGGDVNDYNLGPNPFTNGIWHHLVVTYNYSGKEVKIYVDSIPMNFTTENVPTYWTQLASTADWLWGGNPDRAPRYINATIDELRIQSQTRSWAWINATYESERDDLLTFGRAFTNWYAEDWDYRKSITISNLKVEENLTDFPVLINITDIGLRDHAQNNGNDILFTTSDNITKLSHEIEKYNSTNGELIAWVKANLTSSSDTLLYMYYGNPTATNQENITDVWSNGYEAVWHLHNDFEDSTVNSNHDGTNYGSIDVPGNIADGQEFDPDDASADRIEFGNWNVSGNQLTIQAWAFFDDFVQDDPRILTKAQGTAEQDHVFMLSLINGGGGENRMRMRLKTGTSDSTGTTTLIATSNGDLTVSTWHLLAATYDSSYMRLLKDGEEVGNATKNGNLRENTWEIWAGNTPGGSLIMGSMDGKMDEIRISSVSRSTAWLKTEYNNQFNSTGFYKIGKEINFIPMRAPAGESIGVDVWYGSTWNNLFPNLYPGWNNISVASYLDSSTFTIRYKGQNETSDSLEDTWQIDTSLLHLWTYEYTRTRNETLKINTQTLLSHPRAILQTLLVRSTTITQLIINRIIAQPLEIIAQSMRSMVFNRSLLQSVSLSAIAQASRSFFRTVSQTLEIFTDTIRTWMAVRLPSQLLQIETKTSRSWTSVRHPSQPLQILTQTLRTWTAPRFAAQPIQILAEAARRWTALRVVSQPLQVLSSVARQLTSIRLPSQALIIQAVTQSAGTFLKSAQQTLNVLERVARQWTAPRQIAQVLDVFSQSSRQWTMTRLSSQTLKIMGQATRYLSALRLPFESLALQTITRSGLSFYRTLQQSLGVLSQSIRVWTASRLTSQPLNIMSQTIRQLTANRATTQIIALEALTQSTATFLKSVEQSIAVIARTVRSWTAIRSIAQPLKSIANAARQMAYTRSLSQPLLIVGDAARWLSSVRLISETISLRTISGSIVTRAPPLPPPPFPWPFPTSYARFVSQSISMMGAETSTQTIFREILQSVASLSRVMRSIIVAPPIIYQRIASTVLRVFSDTNIGIIESKGIPWTIIFGLALGVVITVAFWFIRRRGEPEDEGIPLEMDKPPEVPPELPPEPITIPIRKVEPRKGLS